MQWGTPMLGNVTALDRLHERFGEHLQAVVPREPEALPHRVLPRVLPSWV